MTTVDHPELEQTHALADGELSGAALERAQDHLATCERCQTELADIMQLEAMPMPAIAAGVTPIAWYRKRSTQIVGMLVAAAAVTVLIVSTRKHDSPAPESPKLALAAKRTIEARLSWPGAADYREYSVQRGSTNSKESISLIALAELEKTGDLHGVGALALLGGDLEQAKKYLALAGSSPDVLADHAALELQVGDPEAALILADQALEKAPDQMTAIWNRGLALRELGLPHAAAGAFRIVAKHSEPGWAGEATRRADELEHGFLDELALTQRVSAAATTLAQTGAGVSLDDARRLPGLTRIELYDALRAAATPDAIAKLKPLAEAIDAGSHDSSTVAAIARAKPDAAVAKAYLSLLTDAKPDRAHILGVLRAAHADDAIVVALLKFDESEVPDADLPELTKLAAASPDPWIRLIGVEQRAGNAFRNNDLPAAEAALLGASEMCKSGAPSYRCMKIAMLLGQTYNAWQRLPEARVALADAWARARSLSQWEQDDILVALTDLAGTSDEVVAGGLPLVRAYTSELVARAAIEEKQGLRDNGCDVERWAHERLAVLLMIQLRTAEAARELATAPQCKVQHRSPDALAASLLVRGELLHLASTPAELAAFRAAVAEARKTELPTGERSLIDHAEGRAVIGSDAKAGEALLRSAIKEGGTAKTSLDGNLAVGLSYATLAIEAAKRSDATAALGLLADELGVAPRATCVLGLVVDDSDVAVIARGNDGKPIVDVYQRTSTELVAAKVVRDPVLASLQACADVDVIARPPFHGLARILPDAFAWRYVTPRTHPIGPATGQSLIIADVRPPQALGLPHLAGWTNTTGATEITGAAATPSRVLSAIGEARDVVIHAHGLADHGDASLLALSPEGDRYALTAGEVARSRFKTNPLVILAACEAARAAPVLRKRWSLPAAFVTAGARAVVAPTSAVPDDGATKFFDELRKRVIGGQAVATVVRDLRKEWITADPHQEWVRDVVVFE